MDSLPRRQLVPSGLTGSVHQLPSRQIETGEDGVNDGTFSILVNTAKHSRLPWGCIFSSDNFHHNKQDLVVYLGAVALLSLAPAEMLVATHPNDLEAARSVGLRTAYVPRLLEWGPGGHVESLPELPFDYQANDFAGLATQLGA